jgi:hypothetical protein
MAGALAGLPTLFAAGPSLTVTIRAVGTYGSTPDVSTGIAPTDAQLNYLGFNMGDDAANSLTGTLTCNTDASTASPVGTYGVFSCTGLSSAKYAIGFDYEHSSYQVKPAPLTVIASDASAYYGGLQPKVGYGLQGLKNGDGSSAALKSKPSCGTNAQLTGRGRIASPVGDAYVTSCAGGDTTASYVITGSTTGHFSIYPAGLSVNANSLDVGYGNVLHPIGFRLAGIANGETRATALAVLPVCRANVLTGQKGNVTSPAADNYVTLCSGGTPGSNYVINSYQPGALIVTTAPLTIIAADVSLRYGAKPHIGFDVNGLKNGDQSTTALPKLPVCAANVTVSPTGGVSSPVGSGYVTNCGGAMTNGNYTTTYEDGTMAITAAPLTIEAQPASIAYGAVPRLRFAVRGEVNRESQSTALHRSPVCLSNARIFGRTGGVVSPVGSYAITCSGAIPARNYVISTTVPAVMTVTRASLSISPTNVTIHASGRLPASYGWWANFVNRETFKVLKTQPKCGPSKVPKDRSGHLVPGKYTIRCSGPGVDGNYAPMYRATAVLTVVK